MLEYLNALACLLLLSYCVPVAGIMEMQDRWPMWMLFVLVVLALAAQVIDPFAAWLPAIGWPAVALNTTMAIVLTLWRKEAWLFMRCRLGPKQQANVHPLRRVSDMSELSVSSTMRVRGRGAE